MGHQYLEFCIESNIYMAKFYSCWSRIASDKINDPFIVLSRCYPLLDHDLALFPCASVLRRTSWNHILEAWKSWNSLSEVNIMFQFCGKCMGKRQRRGFVVWLHVAFKSHLSIPTENICSTWSHRDRKTHGKIKNVPQKVIGSINM